MTSPPAGPVALFSPADIGSSADPYPLFAQQRAQDPVAFTPDGFLAVTSHEHALDVLRNPAFGTSPIVGLYRDPLPPGAAQSEMAHRINFLDPPDHPRVRGLVSKAFTPRRVGVLGPWMQQAISDLVAELGARSGPVDLLGSFAHQIPSLVISEMLGIPPEDREVLTGFSDATAALLSVTTTDDELESAIAAAETFHAYLEALLDDRLRHPGDDLLSGLVMAEEQGDTLSRTELVSLVATLYSAGHRTTRDLFTNGVHTLLEHSERYRQVVDGSWSIGDVVTEFLRFETPTLFVARVALEPTSVNGVAVPAFTPALVYLGAANRDPAAYERPEDFRPGRGGPPPLSFAFGAHYCLGAALARSEAEAMLSAVTGAWPRLQLAGSSVTWHQRGPFRGVDRLMVDLS